MTSQITFPVGTAKGFACPTFHLHAGTEAMDVTFEEGTHVFTSKDFVLGRVHGSLEDIIGRFSFRYTYNSKHHRITVCGTDYPSADGMKLITTAAGETCIEHACQAGFAADEGYHNAVWNYRSQLSSGGEIMKTIVRDASDALIAALKTGDLTICIRDTVELPRDLYHRLCIVWHADGILDVYDPKRSYGHDVHIGNVESQIGGAMSLRKNQDFANVLKSTGDKHPGYTSFIEVWKHFYGPFKFICTSQGYPTGYSFNTPLYGGHCIEASAAAPVTVGANEVAFIIPICNHHNDRTFVRAMKPINNRDGVWLLDYHNP